MNVKWDTDKQHLLLWNENEKWLSLASTTFRQDKNISYLSYYCVFLDFFFWILFRSLIIWRWVSRLFTRPHGKSLFSLVDSEVIFWFCHKSYLPSFKQTNKQTNKQTKKEANKQVKQNKINKTKKKQKTKTKTNKQTHQREGNEHYVFDGTYFCLKTNVYETAFNKLSSTSSIWIEKYNRQ